MSHKFDLVVRNGTVIDGTGRDPIEADIAVLDRRIVAVGSISDRGAEEIDATGLVVTPGFVDIHTHYDGQAIWSERLSPSSSHGVTTVVMGNCGVGFAPCRSGDHDMLIQLMEGVEDIPEAVLADGLTWDWQTFPEYLDALDRRRHDIDFATQLPHSALRVYVMGERGARREVATPEDLARMEAVAYEAINSGALGFATSRLFIHRTSGGDKIPTYGAAEDELHAIASALKRANQGVLQFALGSRDAPLSEEIALIARVAMNSGRSASFGVGQDPTNPEGWRKSLELAALLSAPNARIHAQVFPRPVGLFMGLDVSMNPFCLCPSYEPLARLPLAEKVKAMRDPTVRARLVSEQPLDPVQPIAMMSRTFDRMFLFGDPPNYEPPLETSVAAQAMQRGVRPEEYVYDLLLQDEGRALLMVTVVNYEYGTLDCVLEMMEHEHAVLGLGDGGAHYGMISDASYPTSMLAYWTRDRIGNRVSLPWAVRALTSVPAEAVGLADRGRVAVGYKADLNIIDYDKLTLRMPRVVRDLPAGGRRLTQSAEGYAATIVHGQTIARDGIPTGILPGRLVRGPQSPAA